MRYQYKRVNDIIKKYNNGEGVTSAGIVQNIDHIDNKYGFRINGEKEIRYYVIFDNSTGKYSIFEKIGECLYQRSFKRYYSDFKYILVDFLESKCK